MVKRIRAIKISVLFLLSGVSAIGQEAAHIPVETQIRLACLGGVEPLWMAQYKPNAIEAGDFSIEWLPVPVRTSGASPVFSYFGPDRLYLSNSADGQGARDTYPAQQLLDAREQFVVIVSRNRRGADERIPAILFNLNLDSLNLSSGKLFIYNATRANLLGTIAQRALEDIEISLKPGLSTGTPIGLRGRVGFQFFFQKSGYRWVFSDDFRRSENEHLLLFLAPPRIAGSRNLVGHWVGLK